MPPLRVFTWHVHGNYLLYLSRANCEFYLPVKPGRPHPYGGRAGAFPWGANVHEVPVEAVPDLDLDCILFQSHTNWAIDQYEVLSEAQRRLPRIVLEHDPPRESPTDTRHPVDDPDVLLVHVTHFNDLMWDAGRTPTAVIEHGVFIPDDARYTGELARGIVVVNNLAKRGRRLGADLVARARERVPLDLVGMAAEESSGLGEVPPPDLAAFMARYRLFFHPVRYTSLGLALLEAMMAGLPVVAPATAEVATVVQNGVNGYTDTNVETLIDHMERLLDNPVEARHLGKAARRTALERFNIDRFARDWEATFTRVAGRRLQEVRR